LKQDAYIATADKMISGMEAGEWDGRRTEGVHVEFRHVDMERKPEIEFLATLPLIVLLMTFKVGPGAGGKMLPSSIPPPLPVIVLLTTLVVPLPPLLKNIGFAMS